MSLSSNSDDNRKPKTQRLFLALWPDDELRQQIKRHSKALLRHAGGRPVALENIHITLAFLGSMDANQQACVELVANGISCSAFELKLDHAGHWPRPRVLWIGAREVPDALNHLVTKLYKGIRDCGVQLDSRPYRAHMTIMRKVNRPPADMDIQPLDWRVNKFVLVKSTTLPEGVKYEVIREWPLRTTGESPGGTIHR